MSAVRKVKVTGFLYVEDDEVDPGPLGPLTARASDACSRMQIGHLGDVEYELADDDD
jgi:hypothetical protein